MITQARLRELFTYDPSVGHFIRIVKKRGGGGVGSIAGHLDSRGYWHIHIDHRSYTAHRLVWVWMTGSLPEREIDHVNGDPSDNRWANLRQASRLQNEANKSVRVDSLTGVKGVQKRRGKYAAAIRIAGKKTHLGTFPTIEAAAAAYSAVAEDLHGEFAAARKP